MNTGNTLGTVPFICRGLVPGLICITLSLSTVSLAAQMPLAVANQLATRPLPEGLAWIVALGSDEFPARQAAGQALLDHPLACFDGLYRATGSSDPEIATSARQLCRRMIQEGLLEKYEPACRWYVRGDRYQRSKTIKQFADQPGPAATRALLAIARFEPAETLSQMAASELIVGDHRRSAHDRTLVFQETVDSPRVAAGWLRVWFGSQAGSRDQHDPWLQILATLNPPGAADHRATPGLPHHVTGLLQVSAERYWALGQAERAERVVGQLTASCQGQPVALIELFDWLLENRQEELARNLIDRYPAEFAADSRMVLRQAELEFQAGRPGRGESLTDQAIGMVADDRTALIELACHLRNSGMVERAGQVLSRDLETRPVRDAAGLAAIEILASIQAEGLEFRLAADTLQRGLESWRAGHQRNGADGYRQPGLASRVHYYRYRQQLVDGDRQAAERELLQGLVVDPADSRLLIEASRFAGTRPDWADMLDELVGVALDQRQRRIAALAATRHDDPRQQASVDYELAQVLNGWAWLALQTGRDLAEAERCARQACRLAPGDPHLLDTLAACLYAERRYRAAFAIQTQALQLAPHDPALRNGLERYRQALFTAEWPGIFR